MSNNPEQNIITLRSVYKFPEVWLQPATDPITGRYADNVCRVDSFGNAVVTDINRNSGEILINENEVIVIKDGKTFRLDDPYDRAWWKAIEKSSRIAQERSVRNAKGELIIDGDIRRYGSAEFYIERMGQQSKLKVSLLEQRHEASSFIFQDSLEGLYQKARLLGNPMTQLPLSDVKEYLLDIAHNKPETIKELYTGQDSHLRILLLDALDKRVILYRDKVYQFGENQILGLSQDQVILWFKNPTNKRILDMIKQQVYPEYYDEIPVDINDLTSDQIADATRTKASPKK